MTNLQESLPVTIKLDPTTAFEPLKTDLKYEFARAINLTWFRLFHGIRYRAVGNIPSTGPMVIAPNHVSYYDPPAVAAGIPFRVRFMAWDALFNVPVLRRIMLSYGAYPVKLKSADKGAIVQTLKILRHGEAVMIFPEGIRHEGDDLSPFEQGPARLAIQANAAVVPVVLVGAYDSWPITRALPRLFQPINIKYYPPVYPKDLPAELDIKEKTLEMNRRIAAPMARRLKAWKRFKQRRATS
jgi:1-acyl-sn-glycerol-3-phosphate acyltransferase